MGLYLARNHLCGFRQNIMDVVSGTFQTIRSILSLLLLPCRMLPLSLKDFPLYLYYQCAFFLLLGEDALSVLGGWSLEFIVVFCSSFLPAAVWITGHLASLAIVRGEFAHLKFLLALLGFGCSLIYTPLALLSLQKRRKRE